jgi:hypothetical protein
MLRFYLATVLLRHSSISPGFYFGEAGQWEWMPREYSNTQPTSAMTAAQKPM